MWLTGALKWQLSLSRALALYFKCVKLQSNYRGSTDLRIRFGNERTRLARLKVLFR